MLKSTEIVQKAKQQISELTGLKPDTVSKLDRNEENWCVNLEMLEVHRIPDSNDVLATYETVLDQAGNLMRYQRTKRYYRSQVDMS